MKKNNINKVNDLSDINIHEIFDNLFNELVIDNEKIKGGDVECESEKATFILCNNT